MQELVLGRKHTERVARAAFVAWRDSARISHAVATMRRRILGRNTRQAWFHFKFGIMWSARLRASNELANRFHRFKILSSAFYDMRVGVRLSVWEQIADRHCEQSTARRAMLAWRAGMAAQHEERLAEEQAIIDERSEVTRPVFLRWLSLYDRRRARREQQYVQNGDAFSSHIPPRTPRHRTLLTRFHCSVSASPLSAGVERMCSMLSPPSVGCGMPGGPVWPRPRRHRTAPTYSPFTARYRLHASS